MTNGAARTKKNYELVADQIQDLIKQGLLKPGDKLESVEQLAKRYQVGRSAIREALSALRAIGLIEIRQGEGTFVHQFDFSKLAFPVSSTLLFHRKEILDFFEVRKIIESGSSSIAAERRTSADLKAIHQALIDMGQAVGNEELGEQADVDFHLAIAKATHNDLLMGLMNQISDTLGQTMRESRRLWLFAEETTLERLQQEHWAIYNAILDQNASLAQQLMLAHLVKVENVLIRFDHKLNKNQEEQL